MTDKVKTKIIKKRVKPKAKSIFKRTCSFFLKISCLLFLICCFSGLGYIYYINKNLPKIFTLSDYKPPIVTSVYSDNNTKIAEFYRQRRIVLPLSEIPEILKDAFVATEDARFYKHQGIDFFGILRALFKNIEAGAIVQGGSTITQQVTKSFFLTPERSFKRKIKEAILAYRLDKKFSKDEILFLYLNQIYLGHGAYGVESAAENYFRKSVKELNLAQCAMLAGLPQAPSKFSPFRAPEKAKKRQRYVLNRMLKEGYITKQQAEDAMGFVMDIQARKNWYREKVPYYTEHVRKYIEKHYGQKSLYTQGFKIYTSVNVEMQKIARKNVVTGLRAVDKRQGYRGPLKHLKIEEIQAFLTKTQKQITKSPIAEGDVVNGVVISVNNEKDEVTVKIGHEVGVIKTDDMKWARKPNPDIPYYSSGAKIKHPGNVLKIGDVIMVKVGEKKQTTGNDWLWKLFLEQEPEVQAALLCIEAGTGHVKAIIGGRDFESSQFNRAIQSRRQPGSAFKPVIYSAAIDKGYTSATIVYDSPIIYKDVEHEFVWKPRNYDKKFLGPIIFRRALAKSCNVVTIKILSDIGIDYAISYARKLGINSNISKDLSIALGSSGVSLLEICSAYSVFDNKGYLIKPVFITKIVDRNGVVLEEALVEKKRVIEKSTAYIMTSLLESVVNNGTGRRVKALRRPVAGKTGTTNNCYDAWFVGYTPEYITGVWVGYDQKASLGKGETGSRTASPIWLGFMKEVLQDKPIRVFQVPDEIVFSRIDGDTGLLPSAESDNIIFECFKDGTVPTKYTKERNEITGNEEFYKTGI